MNYALSWVFHWHLHWSGLSVCMKEMSDNKATLRNLTCTNMTLFLGKSGKGRKLQNPVIERGWGNDTGICIIFYYINQAIEQSGRAVQYILERGYTSYHSSIKARENYFGSLIFMEYIPDVELFCDHLNSPSVSSGEKNLLSPSSSLALTEQLGPALAACARVWFPECDSK